jgi:Lar family restriction alleviation protein
MCHLGKIKDTKYEKEAQSEFLSCPFCGKKATLIKRTIGRTWYHIMCSKECVEQVHPTSIKKHAIKAWNRRKGEK